MYHTIRIIPVIVSGDHIGREPAQPEGRVEAGHIAVEEGRAHVQPEAVSMGLQARVGATGRCFAAQLPRMS
ncbi:MAG: hypothetical protein IPK52_13915 [Chloroflexi bacterium]|nr:hypothetical protein [Chloroflexota bacterium]